MGKERCHAIIAMVLWSSTSPTSFIFHSEGSFPADFLWAHGLGRTRAKKKMRLQIGQGDIIAGKKAKCSLQATYECLPLFEVNWREKVQKEHIHFASLM
jgi:hypothetical protein